MPVEGPSPPVAEAVGGLVLAVAPSNAGICLWAAICHPRQQEPWSGAKQRAPAFAAVRGHGCSTGGHRLEGWHRSDSVLGPFGERLQWGRGRA